MKFPLLYVILGYLDDEFSTDFMILIGYMCIVNAAFGCCLNLADSSHCESYSSGACCFMGSVPIP